MTINKEPISPRNLVTLIQKKIRLENVSEESMNALKSIGAEEDSIAGKTVWLIQYADERELAARLDDLNQLGFLFGGEDLLGWPPADVFIRLREKKLIKGNFKEINWHDPDDWFITER